MREAYEYDEQIDYYAILGVDKDASAGEVQRAWRRLVLLHHPDKQLNIDIDIGSGTINPIAEASSSASTTASTNTSEEKDINERIRLINDARAVLSSPSLREEWERLRSLSFTSSPSCSSYRAAAAANGKGETEDAHGPHVFRHLSLDEFAHHLPLPGSETANETATPKAEGEGGGGDPGKRLEDTDRDGEQEHWSYPCRCSGSFVITLAQLEEGVEVVGCEGCGEWVRVGYEVVEDDDDDQYSDGEVDIDQDRPSDRVG